MSRETLLRTPSDEETVFPSCDTYESIGVPYLAGTFISSIVYCAFVFPEEKTGTLSNLAIPAELVVAVVVSPVDEVNLKVNPSMTPSSDSL